MATVIQGTRQSSQGSVVHSDINFGTFVGASHRAVEGNWHRWGSQATVEAVVFGFEEFAIT